VKFFIYSATAQLSCLRLMGRKMLVALMMEGKFSGEGIHSMGVEEDLMAAMARELVEQGGVGESADAVWEELKRERATHAESTPKLPQVEELNVVTSSVSPGLFENVPATAPTLTLVHSNPRPKKKSDPIWPSGYVVGEQMKLFG
jgi:hypothetical protein